MRGTALAFPLAALMVAGGCKAPVTEPFSVSEGSNCDRVPDVVRQNGITDPGGFLGSSGFETVLGAQMKNWRERKRMVEVAILPDLGGEDIAIVATCLGNRWAAKGDVTKNDMLIVLAPNERRVRIATGFDAENDLTDAEAQAIIDDMTRIFADDHYGEYRYAHGLRVGIDAIEEQTKGQP